MENSISKILGTIFAIFLVWALIMPKFSMATEDSQNSPDSQENLPCFDYYPYGSLAISASLDKGYYRPGEEATLNLSVKNNHQLTSLTKGKVILQIRRQIEQFGTATTILLDEDVIGENLSFPSGQTAENQLKFIIPVLPAGMYQAYINITDNDYTISGISFTQDIAGAMVAFMVENDQKANFDIPYIEETQATIGKYFANPFLPPPTIEQKEFPADLNLPIYNPSDEEVKVLINSHLYYWDESDQSTNLNKQEELTIAAKSRKLFTFTIPNSVKEGTYMVKLIASHGDYQTISKIRFSIPGFAPRIFYSGVSQDNKYFACVGNVASRNTSEDKLQGEIKLSLTNEKGKVISSYQNKGKISAANAPLLFSQDYQGSLSGVNLKTAIYDDQGNLIQEKSISFSQATKSPAEFPNKNRVIIGIVTLLLFFVIILLLRKRNLLKMAILLLILFSFTGIPAAHATVTGNNASDELIILSDTDYDPTSYQVFMNAAIDYIAPNNVYSNSDFDLVKSNYAAFYLIYGNTATPLFNFDNNNIKFNGPAASSLMESPTDWERFFSGRNLRPGVVDYTSNSGLLTAVDTSIPYQDVWTSSDPRVQCTSQDVNKVSCSVKDNFTGNVNITQSRTFNLTDGKFYLTDRYNASGFYVYYGMNLLKRTDSFYPNYYTNMATTTVITLTQTKTINIIPHAPTVDLKANGSSESQIEIDYNTAANLTWTSTDATSCVADGDWSGNKDLNNSLGESTGNLTSNKTYRLNCSNSVGTAADFVNVKVKSLGSGLKIIGDIYSGNKVSGITVDAKSVVTTKNSITDVTGLQWKISDYTPAKLLELAELRQKMDTVINRLEQEYAKKITNDQLRQGHIYLNTTSNDVITPSVNYNFKPEGQVWYIENGPVEINGELTVHGIGTVIIKDGDLKINADIKYVEGEKTSIGFIVKNGKIEIGFGVNGLRGAFYTPKGKIVIQ